MRTLALLCLSLPLAGCAGSLVNEKICAVTSDPLFQAALSHADCRKAVPEMTDLPIEQVCEEAMRRLKGRMNCD